MYVGQTKVGVLDYPFGHINAADPLQLRHGDDGSAEVFPAPV